MKGILSCTASDIVLYGGMLFLVINTMLKMYNWGFSIISDSISVSSSSSSVFAISVLVSGLCIASPPKAYMIAIGLLLVCSCSTAVYVLF